MLFRSFTTIVTSAILALGITAAHADDNSVASINVVFGDLNLSKPADAKILADRLQGAAMSVCRKANPDIATTSEMQECVDTAVSLAMVQIEGRLDQIVRNDVINVRTSMESP